MKKVDFSVERNTFDRNSEYADLFPDYKKSSFEVIITGDSAKELIQAMCEEKSYESRMQRKELENDFSFVLLSAEKLFRNMDYAESEVDADDIEIMPFLQTANMSVAPPYMPYYKEDGEKIAYELPRAMKEEVGQLLNEAIADYENTHYQPLPEQYADVKEIIAEYHESGNSRNFCRFRPLPDGTFEQADNNEISIVTEEEMHEHSRTGKADRII